MHNLSDEKFQELVVWQCPPMYEHFDCKETGHECKLCWLSWLDDNKVEGGGSENA